MRPIFSTSFCFFIAKTLRCFSRSLKNFRESSGERNSKRKRVLLILLPWMRINLESCCKFDFEVFRCYASMEEDKMKFFQMIFSRECQGCSRGLIFSRDSFLIQREKIKSQNGLLGPPKIHFIMNCRSSSVIEKPLHQINGFCCNCSVLRK